MKKVWILCLVLLILCAACGKQPGMPAQTPPPQNGQTEQPQQPEQPSQTPEEPATPQQPEAPAVPEGPEGSLALTAVDPQMESYLWSRAAFLDGRTAAMIVPADNGQQLQIMDLVDGTVHGTFALSGSYDTGGRYVNLSNVSDKYHLSCHDGESTWAVVVDENWQMEGWLVQPAEPEFPTQWQMGRHIVSKNEEGSILVDGTVVLQGNRVQERTDACPSGEGYGVRAVLDSHRLLIVRGNSLIATAYGIYDHNTGALTLLAEGEPSLYLVGERHALFCAGRIGELYGFSRVELDTGMVTDIETGFEGLDTAAGNITFNLDQSRFLLTDKDAKNIKVFDLFSGECVFQWQYSGEGALWPQLAADGSLLLFADGRGWSVELPEVAAEPAPPAILEPGGAVAMVQIPAAIPDLLSVADIVPLEGDIAAIRGDADGGACVLIYDYISSTVLSRLEVESHDGTNELIPMDTEPYVLRYYDGQAYWRITLDDAWQMTREKYDPALHLGVMGDLMINQSEGSISVGRVVPPALQANDRVAYQFVRVLNDHQLLYQAVDRSIASLSNYGVYDHDTGETRAVTTIGQTVVGNWGDTLLIARNDNSLWYEFARVSLTDFTYTPIKMEHEAAETGVNGDYGSNFIQCNAEVSRLMLIWDKDGIRTVQVVELDGGRELYRWESTAEEDYRFLLTDDGLLVHKGTGEDTILWKVEY